MGGANQTVFLDSPSRVLKKAHEYDIVAFCAQECPKRYKTTRASEIEWYMQRLGFNSISAYLLEMWEMFLIVFAKDELSD